MNIKELAQQAGLDWHRGWTLDEDAPNQFSVFAELVVANIDPKSFMTYHERYEAGVTHEREECAKVCDAHGLFMTAQEIRARGKA